MMLTKWQVEFILYKNDDFWLCREIFINGMRMVSVVIR